MNTQAQEDSRMKQMRAAADRILDGRQRHGDAETLADWVRYLLGQTSVREGMFDELVCEVRISRLSLHATRDARDLIRLHAQTIERELAHRLGIRMEEAKP